MDRDEVWRTIDAERAALASLLMSLDEDEWASPSLCAGWTVRDVAAHVISSPRATPTDVVRAMLRAGGDFDRAIYIEARRRAARPTEQIIEDYHLMAGSRRHPLGTTYVDPLVDVLVHTQDIAVPLGRVHAMPVDAAAAAAALVWRRTFPFRARRRLRGYRLVATDTAWSAGEGLAVEGPIQAILLLLTGRTTAVRRAPGTAALQLVAPRGAHP
ncbi:maleylpyruvate isomerase family mycothiol-dependent enzyme [uncultured Cellulomonas sp.]|uniref:maleylpyruvate isomerase family mycothiol-dependent enzyme n=1 Tax=uncultured Cellulomonas sp. TaxID=189682 RepID=UPI0028E21B7C|nr:maleylpyruvate isomerase family mycothiol-dependent enzyme [uncultured Cellulomonas sp.]